MKKVLLLSIVALISTVSFAQQKKMVKFTEEIHNFGVVNEGGRITTVFKFTNIGTTPIFIESARASCGCTTPRIDASKPIAPGEVGEIPVTYNTLGRPGSFNKRVTVTFKDASGEQSIEKIYIRGEVVRESAQPTLQKEDVKEDKSQLNQEEREAKRKEMREERRSKRELQK